MSKYNIPNVKTFEYTKILNIENIEFGKHIIIEDFVFIYAKKKIKLANHTHIAAFCSISAPEEFVMEEFSGMAPGCRIVTSTDDFKTWGFGNSTINDKYRNITSAKVVIKKFAIIGANSVILPGVTIGEGVTVGANSVVTKDLEDWGIYIGNKRVGIRDKEQVLANYQNFLNDSEEDRLGLLMQKKA